MIMINHNVSTMISELEQAEKLPEAACTVAKAQKACACNRSWPCSQELNLAVTKRRICRPLLGPCGHEVKAPRGCQSPI